MAIIIKCSSCDQESQQLGYMILGPKNEQEVRKLRFMCPSCIAKIAYCDYCFTYPAAVILSPPNKSGFIKEMYLCKACYDNNFEE